MTRRCKQLERVGDTIKRKMSFFVAHMADLPPCEIQAINQADSIISCREQYGRPLEGARNAQGVSPD